MKPLPVSDFGIEPRTRDVREREILPPGSHRAKIADPPLVPPRDDGGSDHPLDFALVQLRSRLWTLFATVNLSADEAGDVLRQARWTLSARRREVDEREKDLTGASRLRAMLFLRQRKRQVCEALDLTLRELFSSGDLSPRQRKQLQDEVYLLVEALPALYRGLILRRYKLGDAAQQVAASVGPHRSSVRRINERCLAAFCRLFIDEGLRRSES